MSDKRVDHRNPKGPFNPVKKYMDRFNHSRVFKDRNSKTEKHFKNSLKEAVYE